MTNAGYFGGGLDPNVPLPPSPPSIDEIKCAICSAYDTKRIFTWTFVNGVRKVSRIELSSPWVNTQLGINGKINRDFTYQAAYPFDLLSIIDTLILV